MQKFWSLLEDSVLFQGALLIMVFGTICYLIAASRDIPEGVWLCGRPW